MTVFLPILVFVAGLILYFVPVGAKLQRIGEIMFFCGLLAFLLVGGDQVVSVLGGR